MVAEVEVLAKETQLLAAALIGAAMVAALEDIDYGMG